MQQVYRKMRWVAGFCLAFVLMQLLNMMTVGWFNQFALLPRSVEHLPGIFVSPFLHGSWWHLLNNLVGFVLFSALYLLRPLRDYLLASLLIIVVSGLLVWLLGRNAYHIGASGWVFGLWSLNIASGWFERNLRSIFIALLVLAFYGGMVFGVLPLRPFVSFEYHLFGALSGVLAAWWLSRFRRTR